ncbi:MAG: response regulator transcription factor [Pseudomonadota bacterium]|nr:response regulator transcription factor [Pseudomonadota bacterium]
MTSNRRILLIGDDEDLRDMLTEQLQIHQEFVTESVGNGTDAIERTKEQYFDIILLDVSLPNIDGYELCRMIRRNGINSPIIMLTEADAHADTVLGREAGANDYITKPFRIGVLIARLRAQIREHEQSEHAVFAIGPYTFRPAAKQLLDNETNKMVRLTEKESSIIKYLFLAGERVVSRDILLDKVWGYNAGVTTHTLETHVYRLRQKIERNPSNAVLLVTEPNGYRLVP